MATASESDFPCSLTIDVPLPDHRLASTALNALQVDAELSPLVQRSFELVSSSQSATHDAPSDSATSVAADLNILRIVYRATTNRMLRVAVNGFMESLGVVLQVMQELDVDVLAASQGQQQQVQIQV